MLDAVISRARDGDPAAVELIIQLLPRDLGPAARRVLRDARIREINIWLAQAMPGSSDHHRAQMLAAAGAELQTRRSLGDHKPFLELTACERDQLAAAIRPALTVTRWPRWRQVLEICGDLCSFTPVETANINAPSSQRTTGA